MSSHEVERKIRELRQLESLIAEAQTEAESIKDTIKAHMGDTEEIRAGEYKVTWKAVKTARINTGALRQAFPDIAERFTTEATVRRFCVA